MENLHKVLWEIYLESTGGKDFLEKAKIILKPIAGKYHRQNKMHAFDRVALYKRRSAKEKFRTGLILCRNFYLP